VIEFGLLESSFGDDARVTSEKIGDQNVWVVTTPDAQYSFDAAPRRLLQESNRANPRPAEVHNQGSSPQTSRASPPYRRRERDVVAGIGLLMTIVVACRVPPSHGSTMATRVVNGSLAPPTLR
jgi:hypothetical protein